MGLFKRINKGLKKTRDSMSGAINAALYGKNEIDDDFYEELEEIVAFAKKRNIEISYTIPFFYSNESVATIYVFSTFMDKIRRKRK